MAEQADARDLKSLGDYSIRVRFPLPVLLRGDIMKKDNTFKLIGIEFAILLIVCAIALAKTLIEWLQIAGVLLVLETLCCLAHCMVNNK